MRRLLPVIFSFLALYSKAQVQPDSIAIISQDTILTESLVDEEIVPREPATPIIPRIYIDYGKLLTQWTDFESKLEGGVELLLFERIQVIGEAGIWDLDPDNAFNNMDYTVTGNYFRLGLGYLGSIDDRNKIGLGIRYGLSTYEDEGSISIVSSSGLNNSFESTIARDNLKANWIEFTLNSERTLGLQKDNPESILNDLLTIGFLFRYRIMMEYDGFDEIDVYSIPGYGRSIDSSFPALNVFLKINLWR